MFKISGSPLKTFIGAERLSILGRRQLRQSLALLITLLTTGVTRSQAEDLAQTNLFQEVQSLLKAKCVACHGPARLEGKLNLALPTGIKRGGKNGIAIHPGSSDKSLVWRRVAADEMPEQAPLSPEEKALLKRWIDSGAPGLPEHVAATPTSDEHWSFQKLSRVPFPSSRDLSRVQTGVDAFVQPRLEAVGLSIGAEATRETLIRRVSLDLTGLPPTLEELDRYLNDTSEHAYETMVERYLASKAYGERWGKYWLDTAGYSDSNGYFGADTDRPLAFRYRDYVIRSFNADKPWDQFIREQLAGDELVAYAPDKPITPEMIEGLEAVHFLRNSPDGTDSSDGNPDEVRADKYAVLEGTQQIIGSALLGLTVQCARCHDHKFEPFSQRDYYQLQAVLFPAFNIDQWILPKDRFISTATPSEVAARDKVVKEIDTQIAAQRQAYSDWARQHRQRGQELFFDDFQNPRRPVSASWTNTVPGDAAPAGNPGVRIDSTTAPSATIANGALKIIESGSAGDRALSTQQKFDWTPDQEGSWIQATFDLIAGGESAPYVGYFIGLRDFNDTENSKGGNILFDGAAAGQAAVHVDYPGADSSGRGKIGQSGYVPGRNYGVRITNRGAGKFEVSQVVDGVIEETRITLGPDDLPDGAFGFEYCCGRSFIVDNVLIESGLPEDRLEGDQKQLAALHQKKRQEMLDAIKALETKRPPPIGRLALVSDRSEKPPKVHLLTRGNYKTPGEEVKPNAPSVLISQVGPAEPTSGQVSMPQSTGNRMAFANWLTAPHSRAASLLARVTVNRCWQQHFGTGIVATPENLGYSGSAPSHPELLDYLSHTFIEANWSLKALHRLILNSGTYRQSSRPGPRAKQVDPQNRLLGSYPFRRLDAEAIRDSMLFASGELDPRMFGPYVATSRSADGDVIVDEKLAGAYRRSVYHQQKRTQVVGMLEAFDAPSIVFNCTARANTTVPLQSLKLLNSEFVRLRAKSLSLRSQKIGGGKTDAAIRSAFRLSFGRQPTATEFEASLQFLKRQPLEYSNNFAAEDLAWTDFCQMLLASNAFLYME